MLKFFAIAKIILHEKAKVDNLVFYLHYRITFFLFLISSLFVTACGYFGGAAIRCFSHGVPNHVINTFCYFMSTYIVPKYYNAPITNRPDSIPYPGVGPYSNDDETVYHKYYQWVTFMLFLNALMFYFPQYLWKNLEGGVFRTILGGLDKFSMEEEEIAKKQKVLVRYMLDHHHMHKHWSIRFFICEALNLVNVVGNMYFIDYFLGGTFLTYGADVINFPEADSEMRVDPMTRIFPKITKCTFRKYGASGTLEIHDSICILPVNIINEKIYIFLWFWMISLTAVTALWLLFRVAIIISRTLRNKMLGVRGRWAGPQNLKIIADKCDLGDWFLVYQLGVHMEPGVYGEFLKDFAKELEDSQATLQRKPMLMKQ